MRFFQVFLGSIAPFSTLVSSLALRSPETTLLDERQSGSTWFLPNLDHTSGPVRGFVPNLVNGDRQPNFTYPVYETVSPGDSAGLVNAIFNNGPSGGSRNNCWVSGQPRVVYLPPGTYTLSSTMFFDTDTVLIGDANSPPTIRAAAGFSGDYLIVGGQGQGSEHPCGGSGGETHFSVMIKNVVLDTTQNAGNGGFTALSWAVAQNCALVNVQITMPQGAHTGIEVGGGSTISIADVSFQSGSVGLHWNGSQQGQITGMTFNQCTTGILIDNGSTISIIAPKCQSVGFCVVLNSGNPWVAVVDGQSINSGDFFTSRPGFPNFMVENIAKDTTNSNMVTVNGNTLVGGVTSIGTYIYGNTYGASPPYVNSPTEKAINRPTALAPGGRFPVIKAPQYAGKTLSDVINLKDSSQNGGFELHGDGNVDDTAALQGALNTAANAGKIGYLPFGIYKVTSTITIPSGTQLYGEAWSTISGYGNAFSSVSNPTPVVQIGDTAGQVGTAVVQDIRFTVGEQLPGAILLRVNMAGASPGDVAIFNSLNTIGGTRDTSLSCDSETNCAAAYLGVHLPAGSSAYIENFWSWVADHFVDDSQKGIRTAVRGGVLVEATAGTWLSGVGSEHNWLYQLAYNGAANVFVPMFQSETNYFQGNKAVVLPPAPFTAGSTDPDFSWCGGGDSTCRMGLAQFFEGSNNGIYHYGAASWNFQSLTGVDQGVMNYIKNEVSNANLHGFTTGPNTQEIMRLPSGKQFGNAGNDGFGGSWETLVADIASQS